MTENKWFAQVLDYGNRVEIAAIRWDHRQLVYGLPSLSEPITLGDCIPQPSLSLDRGDARALMDALWTAGLRPSDPKQSKEGVAGELDATKRHLEDMRTLVFKRSDGRK